MFTPDQINIINQGVTIIESAYKRDDLYANSPKSVKQFCRLKLGDKESEVFGVLHLDLHHRLIAFSEISKGTVDETVVYPREVVKEALRFNASAVIFTHNHPSGSIEPSQGDMKITRRLITALKTVDIKVLDHIIVSPIDSMSFAQASIM